MQMESLSEIKLKEAELQSGIEALLGESGIGVRAERYSEWRSASISGRTYRRDFYRLLSNTDKMPKKGGILPFFSRKQKIPRQDKSDIHSTVNSAVIGFGSSYSNALPTGGAEIIFYNSRQLQLIEQIDDVVRASGYLGAKYYLLKQEIFCSLPA